MEIDILCLGNPNLTGDSVGPRVGSKLKQLRPELNVIGTVQEPVLRSNYTEMVKRLRATATHIVVDCAIGSEPCMIKVSNNGLAPGGAILQWNNNLVGHHTVKVITVDCIKKLHLFPVPTAEALTTEVTRMLMDVLR